MLYILMIFLNNNEIVIKVHITIILIDMEKI